MGQELSGAQRQLRDGRYREAVTAAQAALKGDDDVAEWSLVLGEGLLRVGDYPGAWQAMTNALARESRSIRLRWLAQETARRTNRPEATLQFTKEIIELRAARPYAYRDPQDLVVVGLAALRLGVDPKQVMDRVFVTVKQADPPVREAYLAGGEIALEKRDFALAAKTFQEGLKRLPDDPDLHVGLARAYEPSDTPLMLASLEAAFEHNTNHPAGLLLLAEHRIDEEDYAAAASLFERMLAVNPHDPEAWAGRSLLAHLQNQPEREQAARQAALRFWTNNPAVDHFIGRKLSRNYRFAEGAAAQRRALAFDPGFLPAQAQLAQDLLRLGDEAEGWRLARQVQERDGYDVAANNLMTLHDVTAQFATVTNEHFVIRMSPHEAALYGARALALLERARERLTSRYGVTLSRPVLVEVFPEQKDFAVRTFGMPENHGFLGVCFGHVITANSPASRPGQRFNWESMLWHEFAHVVTLQLTRNRMPRWLSEGISVYEERQASPAWGEKLTPKYRAMILGGELTPVASLSAAFMAPPSGEHLQFAYYQSSLVVEFFVERFGADRLSAVLRNLGEGLSVNEAIEKHTVPMVTFEQEFASFARRRAEALAPGLDWEKPSLETLLQGDETAVWAAWGKSHPTNFYVLARQARELVQNEEWPQAREVLERLVAACPDFTGAESAWRQLAQVQRALGDPRAEREAWTRLAERDGEAPDAYLRLCELAAGASDWPAVVENAERFLAVDPLVPAPYRFLAQAADATDRAVEACAAYQALLQLDPPNPAEIHFGLARQLHRLGDPGARRHVLQALEEAPRYREALRLLLEMNPAAAAPDAPKTAAKATP